MDDELKTNAKSMTREEKYQLRKQIIRLWKLGHKPAEIARMVGVTRQMVYNQVNAYEAEGIAGIKVKQLGRPKGSGCKLTVSGK
jgi:transposase